MPNRIRRQWRIWAVLLLLNLSSLSLSSPWAVLAQSDPPAVTPAAATVPTLDPALQPLVDRYLDVVAKAILEELSPAARVGQLFVVNFVGDATDPESDIAQLIHDYQIGGVVLSPAYGNFTNGRLADTPAEVASLTNRLQALAFDRVLSPDVALADIEPAVDELPVLASFYEEKRADVNSASATSQRASIPLWIAVEQLGDEVVTTALRHQFTPLPNQMTLGATWDSDLTTRVGEIVGRELNAVGVNMLLGPALDVYSEPRPDNVGGLGIYSFGGNSFWVSELGKAYIAGVHQGSGGRIATVARHFPGIGAVDRLPAFEVATIQSSQETMRQESLPPFLAVTVGDGDTLPAERTEALMSSHMRYSAFQATGSGRVAPLSFSSALHTVMEQVGVSAWHDDRGLLMTTALGLPAIRRYYDPSLTEFPFRRAALDAFSAGNDLIYLGRLSNDGTWENELNNIIETILFFQSRYESDFDFAAQVDSAVLRIVRAKLAGYLDPYALGQAAQSAGMAADPAATNASTGANLLPTSTPSPLLLATIPANATIQLQDALVSRTDLALFAQGGPAQVEADGVVRQVARDSITILYPDPLTVADALPPPLQADEKIVIFTDSRLIKECASCVSEVTVGPEEIAKIILKFYGPEATDQVQPEQLISRTFTELSEALAAEALANGDDEGRSAATSGAVPLAPIVTANATTVPLPTAIASPEAAAIVPTPAATLPVTVAGAAVVAPVTLPLTSGLSITSTVVLPQDLQPEDAVVTDSNAAPAPGFTVLLPGTRALPDVVENANSRIEREIDEADWLIFAMLNVDTALYPTSDVVKRFLRQRSEQIQGKRVIVLALQSPYFLDATEISQLSTYLGAYSHTDIFVENAVRALFRSFVPSAAPPVSVAGTRFSSLAERLQPDARVQMPLRVFIGDTLVLDTATLATGTEEVFVDDSLALQVGPILDYNGNSVPDGTLVEFQVGYEGEAGVLSVEAATTRDGIAIREILLSKGGKLLISAQSGSATTGPPVAVTIAPPVPLAEAAPEAAATTDAAAAVAAGAAPLGEPQTVGSVPDLVNLRTLVLALGTILIMLSLLLIVQLRTLSRATLVYNMLWAIIVGLAAYVLYGAGLLPGSQWLGETLGVWAAGVVVFIGMILPLLWLQIRSDAASASTGGETS